MKKIIVSLFTSALFIGFTCNAQDIAVSDVIIGGNDDPKVHNQTLNVTVNLSAINGHASDGNEFTVRIGGSGFANFSAVTPTINMGAPAIAWTYNVMLQSWVGSTSASFPAMYFSTITFTGLQVAGAPTSSVTINANLTPYAGDSESGNDAASKTVPVISATPVDLISFNGKAEGGKAVLDWVTAEETGFSHFVVEKSPDAKAFTAIGEVSAKGSGNSYGFTTDQTEALVYYRLTMVDTDGSSAPSKIIPVALDDSQSPVFMVYPNPTADYLQIKYNEGGTVRIVDISGNQIKSQQLESGVSVIDVRNLREGVYYGKFNNQSFKFVKK